MTDFGGGADELEPAVGHGVELYTCVIVVPPGQVGQASVILLVLVCRTVTPDGTIAGEKVVVLDVTQGRVFIEDLLAVLAVTIWG